MAQKMRALWCMAGFGSVCVASTSLWSFWVGAAIMAMVYPCFILIACPSDPRALQQQGQQPQLLSLCSTVALQHSMQKA